MIFPILHVFNITTILIVLPNRYNRLLSKYYENIKFVSILVLERSYCTFCLLPTSIDLVENEYNQKTNSYEEVHVDQENPINTW